MADEEPKIIVDSDWKQEAQQEKERLSEETADAGQGGPLPDPSFLEIVNLLAMQAVIGLGGMRMPDGREMPADINVAKHNIDLIEILKEKTAGQLDDTEQKVLDATLHELHLGFVQATSPAAAESENEPST